MRDIHRFISDHIIHDMSEGVMTIGFDGIIRLVNPAAARIFQRDAGELIGQPFASAFIERRENDGFNQAVLDAVYQKSLQENLAPYFTGTETRQLHIVTSYLHDDQGRAGVIVVLGDVTELEELKSIHAQQVNTLLNSLIRAFAKAVDQRSHYTAQHTWNMVQMAEAFLTWSEKENVQGIIDPSNRRAFLMSIWLHDIGKLAVPLEVLDKATRFGRLLPVIRERFEKIHLINRIALLDGSIDSTEWTRREAERIDTLHFLERIDRQNRLSEEDMEQARSVRSRTYVDESGQVQRLLTEEEADAMLIRKGTLTNAERTLVQRHADMTGEILRVVDFPEEYAMVPAWAQSHHEFLNGTGYPHHLRATSIAPEVRLLTILDIFEAMTANDRPYKEPYSVDKALNVLLKMAASGRIDAQILQKFTESKAWECILEDSNMKPANTTTTEKQNPPEAEQAWKGNRHD